ncbi:GNAT family N-acetyltransferase [Aquibacillus sediminis]|uniref:GNAT family N-acetyltransferase n=1 Tax=Aquibacillus sediminis TaxID=2574734 RepID=UPI00110810E2|nr:GNAT family protein [Aquibacillus sediminis]
MFLHKIDDEVALKLIDHSDAESIFALTNQFRDYLREWLSWVDNTKQLSDTRSYIEGCLKGYAAQTSLTTVILVEETIVGVAGFNEINWSNKTVQIGYWLGKEYQGRGIMTKVAQALTTYAFEVIRMNKVEIRAAAGNSKSRSIPERLDFKKEGCIRQAEWLYDHFVDHVVYGKLKEERRDTHNK